MQSILFHVKRIPHLSLTIWFLNVILSNLDNRRRLEWNMNCTCQRWRHVWKRNSIRPCNEFRMSEMWVKGLRYCITHLQRIHILIKEMTTHFELSFRKSSGFYKKKKKKFIFRPQGVPIFFLLFSRACPKISLFIVLKDENKSW